LQRCQQRIRVIPHLAPHLRGSNLFGTRRFYPSGTRRFYLDSLAEYRSPNSPLLVPPLLRLGFVGVLTSVPVALLIKRAGYTHRHEGLEDVVDRAYDCRVRPEGIETARVRAVPRRPQVPFMLRVLLYGKVISSHGRRSCRRKKKGRLVGRASGRALLPDPRATPCTPRMKPNAAACKNGTVAA
jgi:hypothetical protein